MRTFQAFGRGVPAERENANIASGYQECPHAVAHAERELISSRSALIPELTQGVT